MELVRLWWALEGYTLLVNLPFLILRHHRLDFRTHRDANCCIHFIVTCYIWLICLGLVWWMYALTRADFLMFQAFGPTMSRWFGMQTFFALAWGPPFAPLTEVSVVSVC